MKLSLPKLPVVFILLAVQLTFLASLAIRNPYLHRRMIARLLLNESVVLFFLIVIIVQ